MRLSKHTFAWKNGFQKVKNELGECEANVRHPWKIYIFEDGTMTKSIRKIALASALALGTALPATAATVELTSGVAPLTVEPGSPVGQDFVPELLAAGVTHLYSGPLSLVLSGPATVTFSLVGAESGFSNSLLFDGVEVIKETYSKSALADFTVGALGGKMFETIILDAGVDLAKLLSFSIDNDAAAEFNASDDEFGVFANAASLGALSVFYLGLDDSGANNDDNHDDILVRVEISAVPLPAGGVLLLTALGGLAIARRRKQA